jgi:hypothetical protein
VRDARPAPLTLSAADHTHARPAGNRYSETRIASNSARP